MLQLSSRFTSPTAKRTMTPGQEINFSFLEERRETKKLLVLLSTVNELLRYLYHLLFDADAAVFYNWAELGYDWPNQRERLINETKHGDAAKFYFCCSAANGISFEVLLRGLERFIEQQFNVRSNFNE